MIVQLRVDEKLVHGQVVTNWIKHLGATHVVVANDEAAQDEIQKMALKMAVPGGTKCIVLSIDKAAEMLQDPRCEKMRIMVVCNTPRDALRMAERIKIQEVNVASYGNFIKGDQPNKTVVSKSLRVDEEDKEDIRRMVELGVNCINQTIPADNEKNLKNI